jgi:hypothetical protein
LAVGTTIAAAADATTRPAQGEALVNAILALEDRDALLVQARERDDQLGPRK